MSARVLSFITAVAGLLLGATAAGPAAAQTVGDVAPPQLVSFSMTPTSVDVSTGPKTVTISMRLTDATGVQAPAFILSSRDTTQTLGFGIVPLTSGTTKDGVYSTTITIPQTAAIGAWDARIYPLSDTVGNTDNAFRDAAVLTVSQGVDTSPPETSITAGPSGIDTADFTTLEFSSEAGASFECKLDALAWQPCTSPLSLASLAVGQHTFHVRASDAAGNVDATPAIRTWVVAAPPSGPPAAPAAPASPGPASPTASPASTPVGPAAPLPAAGLAGSPGATGPGAAPKIARSSAKAAVERSLSTRFGVRWKRGRARTVKCAAPTVAATTCSVRFRYRHARYRGPARVTRSKGKLMTKLNVRRVR